MGLADWRYLATSALAAALAIWARPLLDHLKHPIVFFDSLGLGFFAVIAVTTLASIATKLNATTPANFFTR